MEAVNGDGTATEDKGGLGVLPPPSPLTGCYLLIVIGEPHSTEHKEIILQRIAKGLLSWDKNDCLVDLEKELTVITEQGLEGEEARYGERLIQFASENLVTEILIHPAVSTLSQCVRNLLSSFTRHRHIIHAGYTFQANGSWALQDGTFSLADFSEAFQEIEVQRVIKAYENGISLDIHCSPEGDWTRLPKEQFTKACKVRVNPTDVLTTGSPSITNFINYISPFLIPTLLENILESSDVVGNIRFSRPTLYVFPGGQGDAALFGINGFNMLLDGGFSRKACFWDFVRHLDRLDAVLMTRLNNSNVSGITSVLKRKKQDAVYPQIGHFFGNIQERKSLLSPDGDKDKDPLIISLLEEGQDIITNLRHLNLMPQPCYRDSEPINLYHKVGHGTLNMFVLSPDKNSREVREFLQRWNQSDAKLFANASNRGRDFNFPLQNMVSICALLVWQPANPSDTITRILYPGSSPQKKIFEGLDRLKALEFIKHPVCSEKSLAPVKKSRDVILDKHISAKLTEKRDKVTLENKLIENGLKNGLINGDSVIKEKVVKKSDSTESERSIKKRSTDETKIIENGEKIKPTPKPAKAESKPPLKSRSESQHRKKPEKKASPTTPKKTATDNKGESDVVEKKTAMKPSPSATPAKSTKDANNRKVIEGKRTASAAPKKDVAAKLLVEAAKPKVERKPISRRPKLPKAPISPVKKMTNGIQKPDSLSRKAKLDKEGTTDSSTVSTPSADQDSVMKKDISKLTPEELQQINAQELADLKEEQEAVKEIEAVFRKSGEIKEDLTEDARKIKDISIEDKEEYLIIEKEEIIEHDSLEAKEDETQKLARDSEESEKQRKLSVEENGSAIKEAPIEAIKEETQQEEAAPKDEETNDKEDDKSPKTKEQLEESKEPTTEEKPDADKKVSTNEKEDIEEVKEIVESHPDEKVSANVESGQTTTAPTLPEDERIPLHDEIKEDSKQVIEEKHVKEDTKEKEQIPVIQLLPSASKPVDSTGVALGKLPPVVGINLDKQKHIRDIVKTPDEVADLPVHEEVDFNEFEDDKKTNEVVEETKKIVDEKIDTFIKEQQEAVEQIIAEVKEVEMVNGHDEQVKEQLDDILGDVNKINAMQKELEELSQEDEVEDKQKPGAKDQIESGEKDLHDEKPQEKTDILEKADLEKKEKTERDKKNTKVEEDEWVLIDKEDYAKLVIDKQDKDEDLIESVESKTSDVKVDGVLETKETLEEALHDEVVKIEIEKDEKQHEVKLQEKIQEEHIDDKNKSEPKIKDDHLDEKDKIIAQIEEIPLAKESALESAEVLKHEEAKEHVKETATTVETLDDQKIEIPTVEDVKIEQVKEAEEKIIEIKEDKQHLEQIDDKLQELKVAATGAPEINLQEERQKLDKLEDLKPAQEKKTEVDELKKIDEKLQELKTQAFDHVVHEQAKIAEHAESVVLPDSSPEEDLDGQKYLKEIDKLELGRKSPKEREEDVIKIVASVAEVLKSEAPLEELELVGKIPFYTTTELRETHITTLDSPILETRVIHSDIIPSIPEEPEVDLEAKRASLIAESQELLAASSKIISDIKGKTEVELYSGTPDQADVKESLSSLKETMHVSDVKNILLDDNLKTDSKVVHEISSQKDDEPKEATQIDSEVLKSSKVLHEEMEDVKKAETHDLVTSKTAHDETATLKLSEKEAIESEARQVDDVEHVKATENVEDLNQHETTQIEKGLPTEHSEKVEYHKKESHSTLEESTNDLHAALELKETPLGKPEVEDSSKTVHELATKEEDRSKSLPEERKESLDHVEIEKNPDAKDIAEETETVHRMLVTASSEDGGEETVICPEGTITFSKSSESSGRSSPELKQSQKSSIVDSISDSMATVKQIQDSVKESVKDMVQQDTSTALEGVKDKTEGVSLVEPEESKQETEDTIKDRVEAVHDKNIEILEKVEIKTSEKAELLTEKEKPKETEGYTPEVQKYMVSVEKSANLLTDSIVTTASETKEQLDKDSSKDVSPALSGKSTPESRRKSTPGLEKQQESKLEPSKADSSPISSGKSTPDLDKTKQIIEESTGLSRKSTLELEEVQISDDTKLDTPKSLSGKSTPDLAKETRPVLDSLEPSQDSTPILSGKSTPEPHKGGRRDSMKLESSKDGTPILSGNSTPEPHKGGRRDSTKLESSKDDTPIVSGKSTPELGPFSKPPHSEKVDPSKNSTPILSEKSTPELGQTNKPDSEKMEASKDATPILSGKSTPEPGKDSKTDANILELSKNGPSIASGISTPERDIITKSDLEKLEASKGATPISSGKSTPELEKFSKRELEKSEPAKEILPILSGKSTPELDKAEKMESEKMELSKEDIPSLSGEATTDTDKVSKPDSDKLNISGKSTPELGKEVSSVIETKVEKHEVLSKKIEPPKDISPVPSGKSTPDLDKAESVAEKLQTSKDISPALLGKSTTELEKETPSSGTDTKLELHKDHDKQVILDKVDISTENKSVLETVETSTSGVDKAKLGQEHNLQERSETAATKAFEALNEVILDEATSNEEFKEILEAKSEALTFEKCGISTSIEDITIQPQEIEIKESSQPSDVKETEGYNGEKEVGISSDKTVEKHEKKSADLSGKESTGDIKDEPVIFEKKVSLKQELESDFKLEKETAKRYENELESEAKHLEETFADVDKLSKTISFEKCKSPDKELRVDEEVNKKDEKELEENAKHIEETSEDLRQPEDDFQVEKETVEKDEKILEEKVKHLEETLDDVGKLSESIKFEKCKSPEKEIDKSNVDETFEDVSKNDIKADIEKEVIKSDEKKLESKTEHLQETIEEVEKLSESIEFRKCKAPYEIEKEIIKKEEKELEEKAEHLAETFDEVNKLAKTMSFDKCKIPEELKEEKHSKEVPEKSGSTEKELELKLLELQDTIHTVAEKIDHKILETSQNLEDSVGKVLGTVSERLDNLKAEVLDNKLLETKEHEKEAKKEPSDGDQEKSDVPEKILKDDSPQMDSDIKDIISNVTKDLNVESIKAEFKDLKTGYEDKDIVSEIKADVGAIKKIVVDLSSEISTAAISAEFKDFEVLEDDKKEPPISEKCDKESMEKTKPASSSLQPAKEDRKKVSISEISFEEQTCPKNASQMFIESERYPLLTDDADAKVFQAPTPAIKESLVSDDKIGSESQPGPSSTSLKASSDTLSGKSTPDMSDKQSKSLTSGRETPPTAPVSPTGGKGSDSAITSSVDQEQLESDDEDLSTKSQVAQSQSDLEPSEEEFLKKTAGKMDPMSMSFYGELPGDDGTVQGEEYPTYLYEITKAKYSSFDDETEVVIKKENDLMTSSFIGELPSASCAGESKGEIKEDSDKKTDKDIQSEKKEDAKDPIEAWGKPLGLPAPSYLYEITKAKYTKASSSAERNDEAFRQQSSDLMTMSFYGSLPEEDPIASWGKPLGLPSPAPPQNNADKQGTPKKERKLPPNVTAKNKLNDDKKRADSPSKYNNKKLSPVYVDLTYVPHHGNAYYAYVDFFKKIRARYYVFSGIEPSRQVYDALLEAKQTWEQKDLEVTIIPTYDTDILGYWVADNEELLSKFKIDLSPSASRCTINLQDHETSCSAYRLEF